MPKPPPRPMRQAITCPNPARGAGRGPQRRATGRAGSRRVSTASLAPLPKREAVGDDLDATVIKARDRHGQGCSWSPEPRPRGTRGLLHARAGSLDSGVHQTRIKRATTPTGAGGEAEAPQQKSTQGFGGEGELRAGRNSEKRATAEWARLGKQKGLRRHIQLSHEGPPARLGLWHAQRGGEKRRPLTPSGLRPLHRSQPGGSGHLACCCALQLRSPSLTASLPCPPLA